MLGAARVVTEAANPWIGYVATVGTAIIALLAYRLSQRQNRAQQHDAELLRFKAEVDRDNAVKSIHGALYGRIEGTTAIPGLVQVVVGVNGEGTVRDVAAAARDKIETVEERQVIVSKKVDAIQAAAAEAKVQAQTAAAKAGDLTITVGTAVATLDEHQAEDVRRFDEVATGLAKISEQQTATHDVALAALQRVETINGLTSGELLERQAGKEIGATVAPEDQTAAEKHYVEVADDHTMGHQTDQPKGTPP